MINETKTVLLILTDSSEVMGDCEVPMDPSLPITMNEPVRIMMSPDQPGQVVFMPYLRFSEEESCTFARSDVRHELTANEYLADEYRKQFGSGIELPPSGIITR